MSFSIQLQQNKSDPKTLNKSITTLGTVSGNLKESTSIMDPVIKIECNLSNYTGCNYITIPEFGNRSYFVTNIRSITNNIVEFSCHVDVLSTYASQIRSNTGIVRRSENTWNLYLNDGSFKVYQNPNVLTKEFPSGFSTQEFVLAVAGS